MLGTMPRVYILYLIYYFQQCDKATYYFLHFFTWGPETSWGWINTVQLISKRSEKHNPIWLWSPRLALEWGSQHLWWETADLHRWFYLNSLCGLEHITELLWTSVFFVIRGTDQSKFDALGLHQKRYKGHIFINLCTYFFSLPIHEFDTTTEHLIASYGNLWCIWGPACLNRWWADFFFRNRDSRPVSNSTKTRFATSHFSAPSGRHESPISESPEQFIKWIFPSLTQDLPNFNIWGGNLHF